jgi:hypothetical protein
MTASTDREPKQTDGTGAPIHDAAPYYVLDTRSRVGNCGSWWAPKGAGYVCDIDQAGVYTGADVRLMRNTDVPWPLDYVNARVVRHVRVDVQAFERHDDVMEKIRAARELDLRIAKMEAG